MSKLRKLFLLSMISILISLPINSYVMNNISVILNDKMIFFDVPPIIEDGRTLVPLRAIFENLKAEIEWDDFTKTITAKKNDKTIRIQIGNKIATINGDQYNLDVPAKIINGRTLVPLRFISESFDAEVLWDDKNKIVYIKSSNLVLKESSTLSLEKIAENADKTVLIEIYNESNEKESLGSGFFINKDGTIVTNYHVIENAYSIKVTDNVGATYYVHTILGYDKNRDIAIMKIKFNKDFTPVILGDSDKVKVGQSIVAIGNPLGMLNTVSEGIISSLTNGLRDVVGVKDIQISAPVSPGSSGGALFDMYGNVIGIIYAKTISGENLNFAIPINELKLIDITKPYSVKDLYEKSDTIVFDFGIYEGDIKNGVPHGIGQIVFNDGSMYVGRFKDSKFSGFGIRIYEDQSKYEGYFENDYYNGLGAIYTSEGSKLFFGDFINGKANGFGTLYYDDGSICYRGYYEDSVWEGYGEVYDTLGYLMYLGYFKNNEYHGYGKEYIRGQFYRSGYYSYGYYID